MTNLKCRKCGGSNLEFRADVEWNGEEWTIAYIYASHNSEVNCYAHEGCGTIGIDSVENLDEIRKIGGVKFI